MILTSTAPVIQPKSSVPVVDDTEETDHEALEVTKLKLEVDSLRLQIKNQSFIEKQCRDQMLKIEKQNTEIEDLRSKLAKIDVNTVPSQHINVQTYLAGVQTNLQNIDKENEKLIQDINH